MKKWKNPKIVKKWKNPQNSEKILAKSENFFKNNFIKFNELVAKKWKSEKVKEKNLFFYRIYRKIALTGKIERGI